MNIIQESEKRGIFQFPMDLADWFLWILIPFLKPTARFPENQWGFQINGLLGMFRECNLQSIWGDDINRNFNWLLFHQVPCGLGCYVCFPGTIPPPSNRCRVAMLAHDCSALKRRQNMVKTTMTMAHAFVVNKFLVVGFEFIYVTYLCLLYNVKKFLIC